MTPSPSPRAILQRCATALSVDKLSPDDNFFAVGGDSLSAVAVAQILTESYGREVSFMDVLMSESFRALLDEPVGSAPS